MTQALQRVFQMRNNFGASVWADESLGWAGGLTSPQLPFCSASQVWHHVSPLPISLPHTIPSLRDYRQFFTELWSLFLASLTIQTVKSDLFSKTSALLWCEKQGRAWGGRDFQWWSAAGPQETTGTDHESSSALVPITSACP